MISVIPKPSKTNVFGGKINLSAEPSVYLDEEFSRIKESADFIFPSAFKFSSKIEDCDIAIIRCASLNDEEYRVEGGDTVRVTAGGFRGALYAAVTLGQLISRDKVSGVYSLPKLNIEDKPRFKWRGLLLDEARYFKGKDEVKRLIDLMMLHKLNVLHWHLTDDQGWRIEIKKYPLLTEIGSKRKDSNIGGWRSVKMSGEPHSGYYTADDIREIVDYAAARGIDVMPEIDMPAHFLAAIAAYPWLACRELETEVPTYFGGMVPESQGIYDWNRIACAGKESTYRFIFDVIDECAELFPFPYFHIGGDEAPKNEWKNCPECRRVMAENGLKNEEELQGLFNNRIYEYLKSKSKTLVGWNEILAAKNLNSDVVAQYWTQKRDKRAEKHSKKGGKVILSKHQAFYFDMCYSEVPLDNTYCFEPSKCKISGEENGNIFGVEGALWSEWITTGEKLDVTLFPRMAALSEVTWTDKEGKDFDDFIVRLEGMKTIYDRLGVIYAENDVALPTGKKRIKSDIAAWYNSNQNIDVDHNRESRARGGKNNIR